MKKLSIYFPMLMAISLLYSLVGCSSHTQGSFAISSDLPVGLALAEKP